MTKTKGRVPPHNLQAEASLLGAAMLNSTALEVMATDLLPEDFYHPAHARIAAAMISLYRAGLDRLDPVLVADELGSDLEGVGGGAALLTMQANTPATSNAQRYANLVTEAAALRRMIMVAAEIADLGYDNADVHETLDTARSLLANVELPVKGVMSPTLDEFLDHPVEYDWIVPHLIERGDRFMLTAGEGVGKSTLLRQMALQMAAGVHPFTLERIQPVKVLVVDVENPENLLRRKLRTLRAAAPTGFDATNFRIESRTGGINLLERHDSRWLIERVVAYRPDVVMIGPVYKLHDEDPNEEKHARRVSAVLDLIRTRYGGCALLIEAHSPHGTGGKRDLRPFGASLWRRWPEFGYGITPPKGDGHTFYMDNWRGDRDARDWPHMLYRGGRWPWSVVEERF